MLANIKKGLDVTLEAITAISMGALVLDVTWQVITRFILNNPSSWTEELATYLMIWVGLLGSAVALNRKAHLGIDYFVGKFDVKKRAWIELFVYVCVAVFAVAVLVVGGIQLVSETFLMGQRAPATNIALGYVYIAVPVAGFFIAIYSLEFMYETAVKMKKQDSAPVAEGEAG
jgi:TRAP-type C4-dicarboxylate transport system permease small subunit